VSSRLDRLKAAAVGKEAKPHVVQVVPQAAELSVGVNGNDSCEASSRASIAPVRCDAGEPGCAVVMNGAESLPPDENSGSGALWRDPGEGTIRDTRLLKRAVTDGWPITPKIRRKAAQCLTAALESDSVREQLAAVKGIQQADLINLAIAKHENPKAQVSVHVNINADDRAREIKTLLGESVTRRLGVDDPSG
jgi:hypothetical protein